MTQEFKQGQQEMRELMGEPVRRVNRQLVLDGVVLPYSVPEYSLGGEPVLLPEDLHFAKQKIALALANSKMCGPERLRFVRKTMGLSRKRVARALRIEPERLQAWEEGQAKPTRDQVTQCYLAVKMQFEKGVDYFAILEDMGVGADFQQDPVSAALFALPKLLIQLLLDLLVSPAANLLRVLHALRRVGGGSEEALEQSFCESCNQFEHGTPGTSGSLSEAGAAARRPQ